jgi:hypothetical protein
MNDIKKLILGAAIALGAIALLAQGAPNPFLGRWDFNIPTANGGNSAAWLAV